MLSEIGAYLSLHDVAREMQVMLTSEQATRIGQRLAKAWREATRTAGPHKDLRIKRSGQGKHCLAIYPPSMKPRITLEILGETVTHMPASQALPLFLYYGMSLL